MFTGIVEGVGIVKSLQEQAESWLLQLELPFSSGDGLEAGASLAVNGCCLTMKEDGSDYGSFDLLEETLKRTNLGELKPGDRVNLNAPCLPMVVWVVILSPVISTGSGGLKFLKREGKIYFFRSVWNRLKPSIWLIKDASQSMDAP